MKNVFQFQPSQLMAMLALPAEETEKFIAEKAAEGTLVLLGFSVYFLAKISKKS